MVSGGVPRVIKALHSLNQVYLDRPLQSYCSGDLERDRETHRVLQGRSLGREDRRVQRPPFCPWPPLPLPGSDVAHQEPASKGTDLSNQPGHTQHRHFLEVSWPLTHVTCLSLSSQPWSSVKGTKRLWGSVVATHTWVT